MDPVTMAAATIGISSALGAGGGYLTGKSASKDAKRAQRAMLAFMREASQWGYGYPDWMKQAVQDRYAGTEGRINELRQMYGELKDEYSRTLDFTDLDQALQNFRGTLAVDDTVNNMRQLAKIDWNNSMRALEEIPGMTSGARLAAMSKVTSDMGRSMVEASIAGENSKVQRAQMLYGAESGVAGSKLDEQARLRDLAIQYGNLGLQMETGYDALERERLQDVIGLPNRYPGTPQATMTGSPSVGAYMLQGIGQGLEDYMTYNMLNKIYGNKQVNQTPAAGGSNTTLNYTSFPGNWNLQP